VSHCDTYLGEGRHTQLSIFTFDFMRTRGRQLQLSDVENTSSSRSVKTSNLIPRVPFVRPGKESKIQTPATTTMLQQKGGRSKLAFPR
jgi:hypothetical protein